MKLPTKNIENEGLIHVYNTINSMGYIWRDFLRHDIGIDIIIELLDDNSVNGLMLAAQIKSGDSYFSKNQDSVIVPINTKKIDYWLNYSLPVIIIVYSPYQKKAFWNIISLDIIENFQNQSFIKFATSEKNLFNTKVSSVLLSISKQHRSRAKGFSIRYRSERDEDNENRWSKLLRLLLELKYRTSNDFLINKDLSQITDFEEEREHNISDLILNEISFLSHMIVWEVSSENYSKSSLSKEQLEKLKDVLRGCRIQWKGTMLEKWLLKLLGGVVIEWQEDIKSLYAKENQYIESNGNFYFCPICYSNDYEEIDRDESSYNIGLTFNDNVIVYAKCNKCNCLFTYDIGGSGKVRY